MTNCFDKIHPEWTEFIDENKELINNILEKVYQNNDEIYPNKKDIFRCLFYFGPSEIKLVLLGQDPYIGYEMINNKKVPQACGLSFSVPTKHKKIPPSLQNIFKEIQNSYPEYKIPTNGSIKRWTKEEKILLLNASLTVIAGKSNSQYQLWQVLTDNLIKYISEKNNKTIFLLMGAFAQKKQYLIDTNKHKIFTCVHPSPLSAHKGFFGCEIFKKINNYLADDIIKW